MHVFCAAVSTALESGQSDGEREMLKPTCFAKVPDSWHTVSQIRTINGATPATAAAATVARRFYHHQVGVGWRAMPNTVGERKFRNNQYRWKFNTISNSDRN